MKTYDLKAEKLDLITWIAQLQDVSLIETLKMLKRKGNKVGFEIPNWQQEEVLDRLSELKRNPETAIDFDKVLNELEKKHGL